MQFLLYFCVIIYKNTKVDGIFKIFKETFLKESNLQVADVDIEAGVLCELFPDAAAHINAKNEETGEEEIDEAFRNFNNDVYRKRVDGSSCDVIAVRR